MNTSISKNAEKQQIALQYLSISARKFTEAQGNYDESIRQLKTLHKYLDLAIEYGCSNNQMRMALGYSPQRFNDLMSQAGH